MNDEHLFFFFSLPEIPKIEPFPNPRRYLTEGHSASFVCKATGRPTPKYKWYSPSNTVISSLGNLEIKDGNLTINKVNPSLKGTYKCVAYNVIERTGEMIGKDEATVEIVDVYGKVNWIVFLIIIVALEITVGRPGCKQA